MTATKEKLTPASAPALVVRMPMHGTPARLVSMFGLLVTQFDGGEQTNDSDPQEPLFVGLLRKRIVEKKLTVEDLIGAYLHSIGTQSARSRAITLSIDGGHAEFKLRRAGCSISLELQHCEGKLPEAVLRFEGQTRTLGTIANANGDLGATLTKKIWTGSDGARSVDFADAFQYWFEQAVQFDAAQRLG